MPLGLILIASIAAAMTLRTPLRHRGIPRGYSPLWSLGWLALALTSFVFLLLVMGREGRTWGRAWPMWQQYVLTLSLTLIIANGVVAGLYAVDSLLEPGRKPNEAIPPDECMAWSLGLIIALTMVAGWGGVMLQDATGYSAGRLPLAVAGAGLAWVAWRPPAWYRAQLEVLLVPRLVGARTVRVFHFTLGLALAAFALFGDMPRLPR